MCIRLFAEDRARFEAATSQLKYEVLSLTAVTDSVHVMLYRSAKFHYAILVADRSEAGRRPASSLLAS